MNKNVNEISIPKTTKLILDTFLHNGYQAWIVGGYIRDSLIDDNQKNIIDIDITTDALPNETIDLFEDGKWTIYKVGIKYGTIGLINKKDPAIHFEITTFRSDDTYEDGRHPTKVTYSKSLDNDLKRRDFTINSIAYNPTEGIYDPYNGQLDITNKIVKCVGNPGERFSEDYLRILRALRFSSQLNFKIDEKTAKIIHKYADKINDVSSERIRDELSKLLCGSAASTVIQDYKKLIFTIIPELKPLDGLDQKTKYHSYDAFTHTLITLEKFEIDNINFESQTQYTKALTIGKWAALLHDIGKPNCFTIDKLGQGHFYGHPQEGFNISKNILKRLKFSKKYTNSILLLIRYHDQPMAPTTKSVSKMMRKFYDINNELDEYMMFKLFCSLRKADSYAHAKNYRTNLELTEQIENVFDSIVAEQKAFNIKDLKINGNDILNLNVKPSPLISKILEKCLNEVVAQNIRNDKQELIEYVKDYLTKINQ